MLQLTRTLHVDLYLQCNAQSAQPCFSARQMRAPAVRHPPAYATRPAAPQPCCCCCCCGGLDCAPAWRQREQYQSPLGTSWRPAAKKSSSNVALLLLLFAVHLYSTTQHQEMTIMAQAPCETAKSAIPLYYPASLLCRNATLTAAGQVEGSRAGLAAEQVAAAVADSALVVIDAAAVGVAFAVPVCSQAARHSARKFMVVVWNAQGQQEGNSMQQLNSRVCRSHLHQQKQPERLHKVAASDQNSDSHGEDQVSTASCWQHCDGWEDSRSKVQSPSAS